MSHAQFGYYIHGRSPHGNADTSMQHMARAFMKEQNDITARRGLGQNSEQQAFSISVSRDLTKQYRKVMDPLLDVRVFCCWCTLKLNVLVLKIVLIIEKATTFIRRRDIE